MYICFAFQIFTSGHVFVDPAHKMYQYSLRMAPWGLKRGRVYSVNKVVLIYTHTHTHTHTHIVLVGFLRKIISWVIEWWQTWIPIYIVVHNTILAVNTWTHNVRDTGAQEIHIFFTSSTLWGRCWYLVCPQCRFMDYVVYILCRCT